MPKRQMGTLSALKTRVVADGWQTRGPKLETVELHDRSSASSRPDLSLGPRALQHTESVGEFGVESVPIEAR